MNDESKEPEKLSYTEQQEKRRKIAFWRGIVKGSHRKVKQNVKTNVIKLNFALSQISHKQVNSIA